MPEERKCHTQDMELSSGSPNDLSLLQLLLSRDVYFESETASLALECWGQRRSGRVGADLGAPPELTAARRVRL